MSAEDPTNGISTRHRLRARAEQLLGASPTEMPSVPATDVQALLHELSVYQLELETQNEELQRAQLELSRSRDRYANFYEFAPVGYLMLDRRGTILEANRTAARLLGADGSKLVGTRLSDRIDRDSQDAFDLHRQAVFSVEEARVEQFQTAIQPSAFAGTSAEVADDEAEICELVMRSAEDARPVIRLVSAALEDGDRTYCRTALIDVTQQKAAELALRQLNEVLEARVASRAQEVQLLAEAMTNLGEGVMITGDSLDWPQSKIVYVNETLCRITGYSSGELLARTPRFLQAKETNPATQQRLRDALSSGRSHSCELKSRRKDGTDYFAELFVTPLFDAAEKTTHFIAIHRDISERRQSEETLRTSEARLSAILASLSAHIAVLDRGGNIVQVNPAWENFARQNEGVSGRCNLGANYLAVCRAATGESAEEAPRVAAGLQAVLNGESDEFALQYPCHSATQQRWFLLHITPLRSPTGGAVVSHTDISDRVRTEHQLQDREERLRGILETAADAIVTIDQQGIIDNVNSATTQMFGYERDELVGENVKILMPPPYHDEHDGYIARYLATREPHVLGGGLDATGRRKDGSKFPVSVTVSEVEQLGLFTGIIRDVSEQRRLEKQILEIAAEEDRRIGHELHDDIQQQLTGLGLMAHSLADGLVQESSPQSVMAARLAQGIRESANHVHLLSRGLVPVEVDAEGLRSALADLTARIAQQYGLGCDFYCRGIVTMSDNFASTHLYRIAQEAAHNAIKHSQANQIQIALTGDDKGITLEVSDNGVGIGQAALISAGMGLRIMQYRAKLIGATVKVQPAEGQGTQVICRILKGVARDE